MYKKITKRRIKNEKSATEELERKASSIHVMCRSERGWLESEKNRFNENYTVVVKKMRIRMILQKCGKRAKNLAKKSDIQYILVLKYIYKPYN